MSIQEIIENEELQIFATVSRSGSKNIRSNKSDDDLRHIIGRILRAMDKETRGEMISDAMIDNELELGPVICNVMTDEGGSFERDYMYYLVERVMWYLYQMHQEDGARHV